jgi:hypothetical protein
VRCEVEGTFEILAVQFQSSLQSSLGPVVLLQHVARHAQTSVGKMKVWILLRGNLVKVARDPHFTHLEITIAYSNYRKEKFLVELEGFLVLFYGVFELLFRTQDVAELVMGQRKVRISRNTGSETDLGQLVFLLLDVDEPFEEVVAVIFLYLARPLDVIVRRLEIVHVQRGLHLLVVEIDQVRSIVRIF